MLVEVEWVCEEVKESKLAYLCVLTDFLSVNSLWMMYL